MGLNDAQEMLDAAKAQAIIDERTIATLQDRLNRIATQCLETASDTRVAILALAANIEPHEAYTRLRRAAGLPEPTLTDDDDPATV